MAKVILITYQNTVLEKITFHKNIIELLPYRYHKRQQYM